MSVNDRAKRLLASEVIPSQPLADDLAYGEIETLAIIQGFAVFTLPVIVTVNLFIEVPEQMEWFDADVRALQSALYQ